MPYLETFKIHSIQKRWPHEVCMARRITTRQMGHKYFLSGSWSNIASYPSTPSDWEPAAMLSRCWAWSGDFDTEIEIYH